MAEQTEEKGSVILPAAIGLGAGYATKRHYGGAANKLVADAIAGAEGVKKELVDGVKAAIGDGAVGTPKHALDGVADIRNSGANVSAITIDKATKGHRMTVHHTNGAFSTIEDVKLTGEVKKIVGDAQTSFIEGDKVKALVGDGKAGWVAKVAEAAEQGAFKAARKTEQWKKAGGGVMATVGHMSGGNKLLAGAGALVTIGGLGVAAKNMFSSPHADKIEAERAATAGQENARA